MALSRNPLPHCDTKHLIVFSIKPLPIRSINEMRREANRKYGLKRNLFYSDGRLKARLGGKPKGLYTLEWHKKIKDPLVLDRFLKTREIILSCGFQEEFRKKYIAFVGDDLYNLFILMPKRKHFWLGIKGENFEEGLHSYLDGISTFFRITSDISLERLREIILKHAEQRKSLSVETCF